MLKLSTLLVLVTLASMMSACSGNEGIDPSEALDALQDSDIEAALVLSDAEYAAAEENYLALCALCHGDQGEGYKADGANALNHPAFLATADDEFLRTSIARGRPGTPMSAWGKELGGPLNETQVDHMVAYIRSWQVGPGIDLSQVVVSGEIERAKPQYAARCASCHGEEGEGGLFMSLNNPEFLAQASDGYIREAIASGRSGTPMMAYVELIPAQTIDDLVVLIRSWQTPLDNEPFEAPEVDFDTSVIQQGGPAPTLSEELYMPADDIKAELDGGGEFIIIDARPSKDYTSGHVTGAISVPFYAVTEVVDLLPPDVAVIAYCGCPHAESTIAAQALIDGGRERVRVLDEGYYVWLERGYPVTEGTEPGVWPQPSP